MTYICIIQSFQEITKDFGRAHWKNKNEDLVIDSGLFSTFSFTMVRMD